MIKYMNWMWIWWFLAWAIPSDRVWAFVVQLTCKEGRQIRKLAKRDPSRAEREIKRFLEKEIRLAVARGTFENTYAYDKNLQTLRRAGRLDEDDCTAGNRR